jgi:hypothetical protein
MNRGRMAYAAGSGGGGRFVEATGGRRRQVTGGFTRRRGGAGTDSETVGVGVVDAVTGERRQVRGGRVAGGRAAGGKATGGEVERAAMTTVVIPSLPRDLVVSTDPSPLRPVFRLSPDAFAPGPASEAIHGSRSRRIHGRSSSRTQSRDLARSLRKPRCPGKLGMTAYSGPSRPCRSCAAGGCEIPQGIAARRGLKPPTTRTKPLSGAEHPAPGAAAERFVIPSEVEGSRAPEKRTRSLGFARDDEAFGRRSRSGMPSPAPGCRHDAGNPGNATRPALKHRATGTKPLRGLDTAFSAPAGALLG